MPNYRHQFFLITFCLEEIPYLLGNSVPVSFIDDVMRYHMDYIGWAEISYYNAHLNTLMNINVAKCSEKFVLNYYFYQNNQSTMGIN